MKKDTLKQLKLKNASLLSQRDIESLLDLLDMQRDKEKLLEDENERLQKLVHYDLLTGVPNKLLLSNILKKSIANAKRNEHAIAFILLDLDGFKDINDTYGHSTGDEVLKHFTATLIDNVREGDVVARIESDVFVILLEQLLDESIVAKIINKILAAIAEPHILANEVEIQLQASAGIVAAPKDSSDTDEIYKFAQSALNLAKNDGQGLYRFYTDEITQRALQKIAYEEALKRALNAKQFQLYYQPKVDLHTDKIVSVEAFIRWTSEEHANITPDIFIPIADETGLIHKIGYYVIDEACRQLKRWNDKGYDITLSVNLSTNQVKYQDVPKMLEHALTESGCNPKNLELEMCEDALLQKGNKALEMLNNIVSQGTSIAIDKYGYGHSSIAAIKEFPVQTLKVNSGFLDDKELTKAIIKMGKALGLKVIGTRLENREDIEFLKESGCDEYQGFIYSKPVPADRCEQLLKDGLHA